MRNLLLRIAYDGTDYSGWQTQPNRSTIQGVLTQVLGKITGERVEVRGSGRTDAGVHALAQSASIRLHCSIPCGNLLTALNDLLPESIRINSVDEAPEGFHARHDALWKIYQYRIYRDPICPPMRIRYVAVISYRLDENAMMAAASRFEGEKDFRSFASTEDGDKRKEKSFVRTIYSSVLERDGSELVYTVRGRGFLHHMVRNIVGTLVQAGREHWAPGVMDEILAARDRSRAGKTAPAQGLHLLHVEYPKTVGGGSILVERIGSGL
jgi:tRNA pseudouridine38-40 synthase